MKKYSYVAYSFYFVGVIDYLIDFTGIIFAPVIFGFVGSIFMYIHNKNIKILNNDIYDLFKYCMASVLISDSEINDNEVIYAVSVINELKNDPINTLSFDEFKDEISSYNLDDLYIKIENLNKNYSYSIKLNILSSCSVLSVMDGNVDKLELESINKISDILNISQDDRNNVFELSINKYINYKNSENNEFDIKETEVDKIIEERNNKNQSIKKEAYIGYAVATLLIFGAFWGFSSLTIEESCDNLLDYWNLVNDHEDSFLIIQNESAEIWNNFIETENTREYSYLSSEDQKLLHEELEVYKISDHINDAESIIESLNIIVNTQIEIHDDHLYFYEVIHNIAEKQFERFSFGLSVFILNDSYIKEVEDYYYEWDRAYDNSNTSLITVIEDDFKMYSDKDLADRSVLYDKLDIIDESSETLIQNFNEIQPDFCSWESSN